MVSGRAGVEFVTASAVRSAIVDRLGEQAVSTDELLESLESSTSAVYSSLGELTTGEVEVLRATETNPHRLVQEIMRRIERATEVWVLSPIYVESYADAMPDTADSQLLLDEDVARWARETDDTPDNRYADIEVRVGDVEFALAVTESELVAQHDRARRWGMDLFEWYWERATPVEQFVSVPRT